MTNLRTNIKRTFDYLDGHFQYTENGKLTIDVSYVLSSIELWIDNTEHFYNRVYNTNQRIESIIFHAFVDMIDHELKYDNCKCSSYHIKKWFEKYGYDYKEALSTLVEKYKEARKEARKEKK